MRRAATCEETSSRRRDGVACGEQAGRLCYRTKNQISRSSKRSETDAEIMIRSQMESSDSSAKEEARKVINVQSAWRRALEDDHDMRRCI